MKKIPYLALNKFVCRSPLFSIRFFLEVLSQLNEDEQKFKEIFSNPLIQEAIYLASTELYNELKKYLSGDLKDKKKEKLEYSILKYLARMSTRPTPFGLFAGCSLGEFGDKNDILLSSSKSAMRHTRLDMYYLCNLVDHLLKKPSIRYKIKYFSNSSIYQVKDNLRYIDYYYKNKNTRAYNISSVSSSDYLELILNKAQNGDFFQSLAHQLVDEEISIEEATSFIDELIDNKILIGELEPILTGDEFMKEIIKTLSNIDDEEVRGILKLILSIEEKINKIDATNIGNSIDDYPGIIADIKSLEAPYIERYMFQADLIRPTINCTLDSKTINDLYQCFALLNKLNRYLGTDSLLREFIEKFERRYEGQEIPLLKAMDNEASIGYGNKGGDINPLIDDLIIPANEPTLAGNQIQMILFQKYMDSLKNGMNIIEITDKDFENLIPKWDDLPESVYALCEIISEGEKNITYVRALGGSCAANLIARFCHADKNIEKHAFDIIRKEEQINPDAIYAEIVHLPESRLGNVSLRPTLRSYEIPISTKSSVDSNFQIPLSDLVISVVNGRVILKSKRLNKIIIPRLTTAHNYSLNAIPVYQFLCDIQNQGIRNGIKFNWGSLFDEFNYLPRIKYKNTIVSLAKWKINVRALKEIFANSKDSEIQSRIKEWREGLKIPEYVVLADGDNELFVDLTNMLSVRCLYSTIRNREIFSIEEFLFNPDRTVVKGPDGFYANEFIFSFHKQKNENR